MRLRRKRKTSVTQRLLEGSHRRLFNSWDSGTAGIRFTLPLLVKGLTSASRCLDCALASILHPAKDEEYVAAVCKSARPAAPVEDDAGVIDSQFDRDVWVIWGRLRDAANATIEFQVSDGVRRGSLRGKSALAQ